jgi:FMN phosphatase YigB (HAD superfamily)
MQGQPSRVIIFDVYGTLFTLDKPKHLIRDLFGAPPDTYLFWLTNTLCTAQSMALQNDFVPFETLLEQELKVTIKVRKIDSRNTYL